MMSEEDKEIQKITKEFSAAVKIFRSKDYKKALDSFDKIVEKYKDSEFFSVLEIQRRALTYGNICREKTDNSKAGSKTDDDYINEIIFSLNSNDFSRAEKLFSHFSKKKINTPYLDYLRSIYYIKRDDVDKSLDYLEKSVKKDEEFRIRANNEPDFEQLYENEKFNELVE